MNEQQPNIFNGIRGRLQRTGEALLDLSTQHHVDRIIEETESARRREVELVNNLKERTKNPSE